jgi:hypothetical protein
MGLTAETQRRGEERILEDEKGRQRLFSFPRSRAVFEHETTETTEWGTSVAFVIAYSFHFVVS